MIRIRVIKAYELAVAIAAVLLLTALVALAVAALSGGGAVETGASAPHIGEELPSFGADSASVWNMERQEEAAVAVFSSSASAEKPLFGEESTLRATGEYIRLPLCAQGEAIIDWDGAPSVLIYHTHTYEAYTMETDGQYEETEKWRTADNEYNVVRVGEELAKQLRELGVQVTHDTTNHELPVLSTAYARSLQTVSARIEAGESYDLCIDLHRDAYCEGYGENTVATPQGRAAKILFLIGRGDYFSAKPDVQANSRFAWQLTDALNGAVSGLCRDVLEKENRYNQHLGERAILIEAGNNYNTLSEVLRSVPYLAEAIAHTLQSAESESISGEYMQLHSGAQ